MAIYTDPATFVVVLTGEHAGPSSARAAGPFPSFDLAQRFVDECAWPDDEETQLAVVTLESPTAPSALIAGDR